jgi:NADP-dependent 3-hydroxy acid dehydrogenase YdfG
MAKRALGPIANLVRHMRDSGTQRELLIADEEVRRGNKENMAKIAIPPEAIANAVAYAIGQPDDVEIGSIVVRPTAQN